MSEQQKRSQSAGEGRGVLQYIVHQKQCGFFYIQPRIKSPINGSWEHREPREELMGVHLDRRANFCVFLWSLCNLAGAQER